MVDSGPRPPIMPTVRMLRVGDAGLAVGDSGSVESRAVVVHPSKITKSGAASLGGTKSRRINRVASLPYLYVDGTLIRGRYLWSRRGVGTTVGGSGQSRWRLGRALRGRVGMTVQSYQPQINLKPFETAPKQKRLLGVLLAVAVLGAFVLVVIYYRWVGNVRSGTSTVVEGTSAENTPDH